MNKSVLALCTHRKQIYAWFIDNKLYEIFRYNPKKFGFFNAPIFYEITSLFSRNRKYIIKVEFFNVNINALCEFRIEVEATQSVNMILEAKFVDETKNFIRETENFNLNRLEENFDKLFKNLVTG